jgi:hypothetical protein
MNSNSATEERKVEIPEIVETQAAAQRLQSVLDNILADPEFAFLRETLWLCRDELRVH